MENLSVVLRIDAAKTFGNLILGFDVSINNLLSLFVGKPCLWFNHSPIILDSRKDVSLNVNIEPNR